MNIFLISLKKYCNFIFNKLEIIFYSLIQNSPRNKMKMNVRITILIVICISKGMQIKQIIYEIRILIFLIFLFIKAILAAAIPYNSMFCLCLFLKY